PNGKHEHRILVISAQSLGGACQRAHEFKAFGLALDRAIIGDIFLKFDAVASYWVAMQASWSRLLTR
ncbi:MAG: hypothetical protein AAFR50_10260, partial [Pseudomonadota bacterium]